MYRNYEDKLHEECGVAGIYLSDVPEDGRTLASKLVYYALYALQHRGQESAGIAANNDGEISVVKGMGLVGEVFHDGIPDKLKGNIAIGHVRYSTAGEGEVSNAQPMAARGKLGSIAMAHNGNLINADSIHDMLSDSGVMFQTTSDSESILNLICQHGSRGIEAGIHTAMNLIKGAYVLVMTIGDKLIGVRDPHGFHPLSIGRMKNGWVLASETCALDALDAEFVRDVEPGEIVLIDADGLRSIPSAQWVRKSLCVFEQIYFARPDSAIDGVGVYDFRRRCGHMLAAQKKIDADMVMAVPDSGIPAAIGYAEASGIPYGEGLIKNKYMGRTFIQPTQEMRDNAVRIKLSPIRRNLEGKRVIVVDDSIVRGTTSRRIVKQLRAAGASEVHMCISSPPVCYSCYFGIDTPYREKLIAVQKTEAEIEEYLGADSLIYLSHENLAAVCGNAEQYCKACFDGNYPMEVPATACPSGFLQNKNL